MPPPKLSLDGALSEWNWDQKWVHSLLRFLFRALVDRCVLHELCGFYESRHAAHVYRVTSDSSLSRSNGCLVIRIASRNCKWISGATARSGVGTNTGVGGTHIPVDYPLPSGWTALCDLA